MRTNKKQRAENARLFYQLIRNSNDRAAIVVERVKSRNVNFAKCRFWANITPYASQPSVIAESNFGVTACFKEFIANVTGIAGSNQLEYYNPRFNEWFKKNVHMHIVYNDEFVFMLQSI